MIHFYEKLLRPQPGGEQSTQIFAQAFVGQFNHSEYPSLVERYLNLSLFFLQNKKFLVDLTAEQSKIEDKVLQLKEWFKLNLKDLKFLNFLIARRKQFFLAEIFKHVAFLAAKRNEESLFLISTSRELDRAEKDLIGRFLLKQMDFSLRVMFAVDTTLISGVRIESDCFLYEKSIKSRLRKVFITLRSIAR